VAEVPLGEYRRLTYAIQTRPSNTPGAGDHPIITEWKDDWATSPPTEAGSNQPWFSTLVNPTTNGNQLTYSFGSENTVTLVHVFDNGVDPPTNLQFDSFSFRNITDGCPPQKPNSTGFRSGEPPDGDR